MSEGAEVAKNGHYLICGMQVPIFLPWTILGIVAVIIIALVVWYMMKQKKDSSGMEVGDDMMMLS